MTIINIVLPSFYIYLFLYTAISYFFLVNAECKALSLICGEE